MAKLSQQLATLEEQAVKLDAVLLLFDPAYTPDSIHRRYPKRVHLFGQGVLSTTILDTLRRAGEPMSAVQIRDAIVAAMGQQGEDARRVMDTRVRTNITYQLKRGLVERIGRGNTAVWRLT